MNISLLSENEFMNHPWQNVFLDYDFSFSTFKVKKKKKAKTKPFLYIITSLLCVLKRGNHVNRFLDVKVIGFLIQLIHLRL